jgi:hypothetical protein
MRPSTSRLPISTIADIPDTYLYFNYLAVLLIGEQNQTDGYRRHLVIN